MEAFGVTVPGNEFVFNPLVFGVRSLLLVANEMAFGAWMFGLVVLAVQVFMQLV